MNRIQTSTKTINLFGLVLTLTIEEDLSPRDEGWPNGYVEAGRVVAVEAEVDDEERAYKELADLAKWI